MVSAEMEEEQKKAAAVRMLQRVWRKQFSASANHVLLVNFDKAELLSAHVRSISFETLVVKLREKPLIATAKAMLQRVHMLATCRHGSPTPRALAPGHVNVRVFLAGYMIAYRPTHVFESMGTLEHPLLEAATRMLNSFEAIMGVLRDNGGHFDAVPPAVSKDFPTLLFEYLRCFKAWKGPDEEKLVCRIRHALVALYQAEAHLPADEPADSRLKLEFRTQVERLRSKLSQIRGPDALEQFDEQRLTNTLPVTPATNVGVSTLPGRMTNEQLAHELLVNPAFQLDESGGCHEENPVFHHIRESFHQAFWDSLADDLRLAPPCYARVIRVLAEIRDGLKDLGGARVRADEAIDIEWIRQQADAGQYDWPSCRRLVGAIVEMVRTMQAPQRDAETNDKWVAMNLRMEAAQQPGAEAQHPGVFCAGLEFLLERVNALRIDAANARLRLISPVIRDHGIDYERGKFQDKIDDGTFTIERTSAWITETLRKEVDGRSVTLEALAIGQAAAFVHVHTMAMLGLVTTRRFLPVRADAVPETLQLDVHRIGLMQAEFRYLTTASTLLLGAAHSLGRNHHTEVRARIDDAVTSHRIEVDDEAKLLAALELALAPIADEALRRTTLCVLTQSTSPTDPVRRLLEGRLRALLVRVMRDGRLPADLRAFAQASAILPRVEMLATRLMSLCNLNRTVHLPMYNRLIREAATARIAEGARAVLAERAPKRGGGGSRAVA
jgi:hypothetical protein